MKYSMRSEGRSPYYLNVIVIPASIEFKTLSLTLRSNGCCTCIYLADGYQILIMF